MRLILLLITTLFLFSCENHEDDTVTTELIEPMFIDNPERLVKVNIFYVESGKSANQSSYSLSERDYIDYLNGHYFHRLGIGLVLNESKTIINDDLYDLRDNQGSEPSTFLMQSKASYDKNKINIYIIKRSNIKGIAGIGRDQRVLLTDQNLYTTSSPHEIGHALGLFHSDEEENIMSYTLNKDARRYFNKTQEERMKRQIDKINLVN